MLDRVEGVPGVLVKVADVAAVLNRVARVPADSDETEAHRWQPFRDTVKISYKNYFMVFYLFLNRVLSWGSRLDPIPEKKP